MIVIEHIWLLYCISLQITIWVLHRDDDEHKGNAYISSPTLDEVGIVCCYWFGLNCNALSRWPSSIELFFSNTLKKAKRLLRLFYILSVCCGVLHRISHRGVSCIRVKLEPCCVWNHMNYGGVFNHGRKVKLTTDWPLLMRYDFYEPTDTSISVIRISSLFFTTVSLMKLCLWWLQCKKTKQTSWKRKRLLILTSVY